MPFHSQTEWCPDDVIVWVTDFMKDARTEILNQRPPYRIVLIPFKQAATRVRGMEIAGYDFVHILPQHNGRLRLDLEDLLKTRIR